MNQQIKKENGITLVSLVITIIILLILAGITVVALIGDNGVINRATTASEAYELSAIKEKIQLDLTDAQTDAYLVGQSTLTKTKVKEILAKYDAELKEDNDTIVVKNHEMKLSEIWGSTMDTSK